MIEAVKRANDIVFGKYRAEFFERIITVTKFTHTESSVPEVTETLWGFLDEVEAIGYNRFWSRAFGYYSGGSKFYVNEAKLNRALNSVVNTVVHEWVHAGDGSDKGQTFGHGDNYPGGKDMSAPYLIGSIAQEIADKKWGRDSIVYVPTFWQRFKNWLGRIF